MAKLRLAPARLPARRMEAFETLGSARRSDLHVKLVNLVVVVVLTLGFLLLAIEVYQRVFPTPTGAETLERYQGPDF